MAVEVNRYVSLTLKQIRYDIYGAVCEMKQTLKQVQGDGSLAVVVNRYVSLILKQVRYDIYG